MSKSGDITSKAAAAAANRSKKKGKSMTGYYISIGAFVAVTLIALIAGLTGGGKRRSKGSSAPSPLDKLVNDRTSDVTSAAEGNFTAAASPFFNKWTLADLKYGFDGVSVSNMVGMAGAVQYCEQDDSFESGTIPLSFDARAERPECFTAVSDSGNCTGSYAIAAATSLAQRFCTADDANYKNLRLSSQQILSCDKKSHGCDGGVADAVFSYVKRRGLFPEECLPYAGKKGAKCETKCDASKKLKPISYCVTGGVKKIKAEVMAHGPVVIPLLLRTDFLVYSGGVYTPTDDTQFAYSRDGKPIVHVVTVLGWGKSKGTPYWIVENSWGATWGEQGYARIAVDEALMEHYAIVATPETEENVARAARKKKEAEEKAAAEKQERRERDERIAARRAAAAAEQAAAADEEIDDLDLDDGEEGGDEAEAEADVEI